MKKNNNNSTNDTQNCEKNKKIRFLLFTLFIIIFLWCIIFIIQNLVLAKISSTKNQMLIELFEQNLNTQNSTEEIDIQLQEFLKINPEFIGWLNIGETKLPVVKTNNNTKYLDMDFYGKKDKRGTVFMDFRNNPEFTNETQMLYGHNYNYSKEMFYEIEKLKKSDYATKYPFINFNTIYGNRSYVLCTVFVTDIDENSKDYFNYHNLFLTTDNKDKQNFIDEIKKRALLRSNIEFNTQDSLILLSTCGYEFSTQRIVAVAKLISDEETKILSPNYSHNPNAKMPLLWELLYK